MGVARTRSRRYHAVPKPLRLGPLPVHTVKPVVTLLSRLLCIGCLLLAASPAAADPAPFDLAGPTLEITVTRAAKTLPISEAPNLSAGDQLWIRADLPPDQSARYRLVVAFLRGATDPPPKSWFFGQETWKPEARSGLRVGVPQGARQALVFLVPATGGDFQTLREAVRGRPGAFVRASQDLEQAELDRSRLDVYLAEIHEINERDPERLKTVAPVLARSLAIKLDSPCLEKPPALQASCLTQGQESLILSDGHGSSIARALTSGSTADLVQQLSAAPPAGSGAYSPYIGAVMDIVRIMDSFRTAQFQYLPAMATPREDKLSLLLNSPPSFHDPKSVLVVALPAVGPAPGPLVHATADSATVCIDRTPIVLSAEGSPLIFSTAYAHDLRLRVNVRDGETLELPLKADAANGGFVADGPGADLGRSDGLLEASVHGAWGFDAFDGPAFHLSTVGADRWQVAPDDQLALVAGREGAVRLRGGSAACVEDITIRRPRGEGLRADWKAVRPDEVIVKSPAGPPRPGPVTLLVKSYGRGKAEEIALRSLPEPSRLERFEIHTGDAFGILRGSHLDEVDHLTLMGVDYRRDPFAAPSDTPELALFAAGGRADQRLADDQTGDAKVTLKDGRSLDVDVSIGGPRPSVTLIAKSVQAPPPGPDNRIQLVDADGVARGSILTFSIRSQVPATFSGDDKLEVATLSGAFTATLTLSSGLTLEDPQVAIATLDTGKAFSASAGGPLHYRIVADGVAGDWRPLATLIRVPILRELKCPAAPGRSCTLLGARLFLLEALSGDPAFRHPVSVPDGFPGSVLVVPRPTDGRLYVRLRDDPSVVDPVTVPQTDARTHDAGALSRLP